MIANPLPGVPMEKKHNHKRAAKQLQGPKQRSNPRQKSDELPSRTPWLQMISEDSDEDQARRACRNAEAERNGRRATLETNLYVAEQNIRSVRKFL